MFFILGVFYIHRNAVYNIYDINLCNQSKVKYITT